MVDARQPHDKFIQNLMFTLSSNIYRGTKKLQTVILYTTQKNQQDVALPSFILLWVLSASSFQKSCKVYLEKQPAVGSETNSRSAMINRVSSTKKGN
jgi:hypothetical protein